MYGEEKSDSLIVAANLANNPQGAESVERRSGAKGNAEQPHMRRTQSRESMSQRLSRVREAAKQRKKERFTALFHLLTAEALENAFLSLSRKAAAGVDGVRWKDYAENLKVNIADLHRRLHQGSYRAQPGRRHYIPKADGKQRPLGIASLEDKIVQYALVKILNAVYENDFMGFSYGFRPGRSQHNALDALATGLVRTNVNWVLDADISQFFDKVSHEWLIRFIEHRIGDQRVIRLIRKWLTAGTSEEGEWRASEEGTPQGAVISPLLANIYLHYVFDLWAHQWRRRYATGNVVMVRYADDIVIGFDKRYDARRFRISDTAKAMSLIAAGGGRAVSSGDTDQLQSIAPGQPFRLMQKRSAADVAIMQEIVRQVPELRPAVYSLIDRDIHSALSTIERVEPAQVPRKENAWVPESSVMEFTPEQEKAIQKAIGEGEVLPSISPVSLYDAIVRDYTGRTESAQAQTLIITHLNDDRRVLNRMIHDEKMRNGELGEDSVTLPVLVTSNIRDGELRKVSTWEAHKGAIALVDNQYHQIVGVSKADQLITLRSDEGTERLISPREASAEGVTLYRQESITVSPGDRMRFSKSDTERGYVANSVWRVESISGDSVTLNDGKSTRTVTPAADKAEAHVDLAYAITTHGAQGASEPFSIELEGVTGARERMVSFESAYVALSRMKQHTQVYTDEQIKDIITDVVRGLERQKGQHERFQLPDEPENRLRNEAVQKVVADNQQQDRLQQIERDMVRDLTREKTLGGD